MALTAKKPPASPGRRPPQLASPSKSRQPTRSTTQPRSQDVLVAAASVKAAACLPLGEINGNSNASTSPAQKASPTRSRVEAGRRPNASHQLPQSSSPTKKPTSSPSKENRKPDRSRARDRENAPSPSKRSKSATGLSALLSRGKSSNKAVEEHSNHRKQPISPSKSSILASQASDPPQTPIWAQFASTEASTKQTQQKIPLNDVENLRPHGQRFEVRPRSMHGCNGENSPSLVGAVLQGIEAREAENHRQSIHWDGSRPNSRGQASDTQIRPQSRDTQVYMLDKGREKHRDSKDPQDASIAPTKRGSRVKAAVAALNGKTRAVTTSINPKDSAKEPVDVETEFEKMLESRNIPTDVRDKMRALDRSMKSSLLKQNGHIAINASSSANETSAQRPALGQRSKTDDFGALDPYKSEPESSPRKGRPRSLTFSRSKTEPSASPTKKLRSGRSFSHLRKKSVDLPKSPSSASLSNASSVSLVGVSGGGLAQTSTRPIDFINYLQATPQPTVVEIGRLQKLRQLLRNETVAWVDTFMDEGGMAEMVGLLNRIMDMEWREEHEDNLLHQTLTCLKALLTTSTAMEHLERYAPTLFPRLLAMLYSSGEERRAPAEYTTRALIIALLFAYLAASPTEVRATALLSYLEDPRPVEASRPPGFISEMHRERPYRRWCAEMSNVTKEVFWIFLHHLNVIPRPDEATPPASLDPSAAHSHGPLAAADLKRLEHAAQAVETRSNGEMSACATTLNAAMQVAAKSEAKPWCEHPNESGGNSSCISSYARRHFPPPRPPVPAAPYVGGVEWDATMYLATHLDLLNGLLAAIPHAAERCTLRTALRDSGLERVLGGSLRTCKEKFYGAVHAGLRTWVAAALEDGWDTSEVREGSGRRPGAASPKKSPSKKGSDPAPQLDMPKLDLVVVNGHAEDDSGWLS